MNAHREFVYGVFDRDGLLVDVWATEELARKQMQDFDFAFIRALRVKDE